VAQHLLLTAAARSLSLAQVERMTDAEAETTFRQSGGLKRKASLSARIAAP